MSKLRNWIKILKVRVLVCLAFLSIPGIACPDLRNADFLVRQTADANISKNEFRFPETYDDLILLMLSTLQEEFYELNSDDDNKSLAEFFVTLAKIGALIVEDEDYPLLDLKSRNLLALHQYNVISDYDSNFDIVQCKNFLKKCRNAYKATKKYVSEHIPEIVVGGLAIIALASGGAANAHAKNSPGYNPRNPCLNPDHHRSPYSDGAMVPKNDFDQFSRSYGDHHRNPRLNNSDNRDSFPTYDVLKQSIRENPEIREQISEEIEELRNCLSNIESVEELADPEIYQNTREKSSYISHQLLENFLESTFDEREVTNSVSEISPSIFRDGELENNEYAIDLTEEILEEARVKGHENVDKFFGTKQALMFIYGIHEEIHRGSYESAKELAVFLSDLAVHPVSTATEIYNALSALKELAHNDEWGLIGKAFSPDIYQLFTEWGDLSVQQRGELIAHAVGKHGTDILVPGATSKCISKGAKSARGLSAAAKNLKKAEGALALEAAAEVGNAVKAAEITIDNAFGNLINKTPSEAYIAAKNGGRHADLIPKFSKKPVKEIEKSIRSYEKLIAEHKDKIAHPSKYCPEWDTMDPRRQNALINKRWPAEIQCYTEQKDILATLLEQRQ